MRQSEAILAHIGHVYRVRRKSSDNRVTYVIETVDRGQWKAVREKSDPGAVAALLVKSGAVADHEAAFNLIRG